MMTRNMLVFIITLMHFLLFIACKDPALAPHQTNYGGIVLKNGLLIDGTGAEPVEEVSVLIQSGQIRSVGRYSDVALPDSVTVVDLERATSAYPLTTVEGCRQEVGAIIDEGADLIEIARERGDIFGGVIPVPSDEMATEIARVTHEKGTVLSAHLLVVNGNSIEDIEVTITDVSLALHDGVIIHDNNRRL